MNSTRPLAVFLPSSRSDKLAERAVSIEAVGLYGLEAGAGPTSRGARVST